MVKVNSEIKEQHIFNFKTDLSGVSIPDKLNNPFVSNIPEIARIAARDFQEFISAESQKWEHDFSTHKGKMFGVLVVKNRNGSYGYLGTISGKLSGNKTCKQFVPSVFDDSTDDYFINKGMTALTEMGIEINRAMEQSEIISLTEKRKLRSLALQKRLFENSKFLNSLGMEKNVIEIFKSSSHGNPPSAAGECAAPKLLNYAFKQKLKPLAMAEFWWGESPKNLERKHKEFYPACKNKCRPILECMLDDMNLFESENAGKT